jgi:hypothetical protein
MEKTNNRASSMAQAADHICNLSGADAHTVMVGPALVYGEDDVCVIAVSGPPGQTSSIKLGRFVPELDGPLYDAASTVLTLTKADELTISDGRKKRDELIAELRQHFDTVRLFDCDKELALAYAETFPSEESRRIAQEVLNSAD